MSMESLGNHIYRCVCVCLYLRKHKKSFTFTTLPNTTDCLVKVNLFSLTALYFLKCFSHKSLFVCPRKTIYANSSNKLSKINPLEGLAIVISFIDPYNIKFIPGQNV